MATTSYIDPATAWAAYALQGRTDESGLAVDDLNGEDMRIVLEAFSAGVLSTDAFQVREDSPTPGMTVRVGSGTVKADVAILEGTEAGQGKYAVRLGDGVTDVTVPAADVSNPRIDEVYVVVQDDIYDSNGGNVVPRIGYRRGDAASSPSAPGPDGSWTAYLKLASINVAAGTTAIEAGDITDERVFASLGTAFGGAMPVGGGFLWFTPDPPPNHILARGQILQVADWPHLFKVWGTRYGGDGVTTFGAPDLRQRFPLGKAVSGTGSTLGATGGAIDHTHSGPPHTHSMSHTHQVDPPNTSTTSNGSHTHNVSLFDSNVPTSGGSSSSHSVSQAGTSSNGSHTHDVNIPAFTSGGSSASSTGDGSAAGATDPTGSANPPFLVVEYAVRAA